jgi:hypothetical protein
MDKTQQQINELTAQVQKLSSDLQSLSSQFYKNNFSSSQTFNKACSFQDRLKVPHYTSAPAVCEVGDIIEIGGKLYICTVANTTFTMVGTQS